MNDRQTLVGEQEALSSNNTAPTTSSREQQITPALFSARTKPHKTPPPVQEQAIPGIQVQLLSPAMSEYNTRSIPFPKAELVVQLQGAGVEALDKEVLQLFFYKKNQEGGLSEQLKEESFLIKPLLQEQEENSYLLKLSVDFHQHIPNLVEGDFSICNCWIKPKLSCVMTPNQNN